MEISLLNHSFYLLIIKNRTLSIISNLNPNKSNDRNSKPAKIFKLLKDGIFSLFSNFSFSTGAFSSVSKVLYNRITAFLNENKLIYTFQFCFDKVIQPSMPQLTSPKISGSILRSLLFLIYMNNLRQTSKLWHETLNTLREKFPSTEFFLVRIFLCLDWLQENTVQKKLRIWTLFTQW